MSVIYRARQERMEKYFNLFKRSEKHNKDKNKCWEQRDGTARFYTDEASNVKTEQHDTPFWSHRSHPDIYLDLILYFCHLVIVWEVFFCHNLRFLRGKGRCKSMRSLFQDDIWTLNRLTVMKTMWIIYSSLHSHRISTTTSSKH